MRLVDPLLHLEHMFNKNASAWQRSSGPNTKLSSRSVACLASAGTIWQIVECVESCDNCCTGIVDAENDVPTRSNAVRAHMIHQCNHVCCASCIAMFCCNDVRFRNNRNIDLIIAAAAMAEVADQVGRNTLFLQSVAQSTQVCVAVHS